MARVEDTIEHNMKLMLEDWKMYRATKEQRKASHVRPIHRQSDLG